MSAITAKASRKMKKYAVLTREPRCFLGSFDFSWEQRKLGDIGKARSGVGFPDADQGGVTGVPFFKVSDMNLDGNENEMIVANNYVTAEQIADHRWSPITELPAIFFAKVGAAVMLNRKRLCRFPFLLDNNTMAYSLSPTKWDADFAKALFGTVDLTSLVQVGALPSYNAGDVESMGIYLPSLFEQEQIGAFFKLLDNLITLHQRKCVFLFGLFQASISMIFTASTFSWEQRKLTEFVEFFSGLTYTPNDVQENGTLVLRSSNVSNGEVVDADNINVNPQVVNSENVKVGDIVVVVRNGSRSLIGKHAQIKAFMPNTVIGAFMTGIRSECPEFTNALLNTSRFEEEIAMNMGATINQITGYMFSKMEFKVPCLDEQKKIGEYFEKLDNLITLHQRECISFTVRAGGLILTANKKRTTSSWEQRKLSEIADKVTEKNSGLQYVETFTNSAEFGIISQRDFFDHDIAKLSSLDGYYIVKNEDFVYNPRISTSAPVGPINRNKLGRTGVMSPLYTVFRPHDVDTTYLEHFFKCAYWHSFMNFNGDSGARSDRFSIKNDVFFQMPIPLPHIDEQRKIGELLTCLDHLITLHQRKPFLMKWRTSDANRNQTNRLVL